MKAERAAAVVPRPRLFLRVYVSVGFDRPILRLRRQTPILKQI
jgi:hypothetical protein